MEPRIKKDHITDVSSNSLPKKGDDVFFRVAAAGGNPPKTRMGDLVSLDDKTLKVVQLKPKKPDRGPLVDIAGRNARRRPPLSHTGVILWGNKSGPTRFSPGVFE